MIQPVTGRMLVGNRRASLRCGAAFARLAVLLISCLRPLVPDASAQSLTAISDTLFNADGTKASGRIVISWDPFTTADSITIDGGTLSYTIPASGANWGKVDLPLAPNAGATPAGTSYRARYYLANGASYQETWVIPASGPVQISDIRAAAVPIPDVAISAGQITGVVPLDHGGTGGSVWTAARCVRVNASGSALESAPADCGSGGGSAHAIQEEGSVLPARGALNFIGGAITAGDDAGNNRTNISVSITDADVPGGITRDSEINVQGTAGEITSSGGGVAPTLSLAAALDLSGKVLQGTDALVFEGSGADASETTLRITNPSADRIFTIPNADSNSVQPSSAGANQFATGISSAGAVSYAQPAFSNLTGAASDGQVPNLNTLSTGLTASRCVETDGGGLLTVAASTCGTGGGGGDSIRIEDGDNAGTFTAMADADFDDSGAINFTRAAGPPDVVTATIRAAAVSADELDEAGVEAGLEAVLDLQDLQGAVTDAQVPNDITITTTPSGAVLGTGRAITSGNGLTGGGDLSADRTLAVGVGLGLLANTDDVSIDYSQTLAGNPALAISTTIFSDDCPGGGFLAEGSTANTNEQLHCFPSADETDTTRFIVEDTTAVTEVDGTGLTINSNTLDCDAANDTAVGCTEYAIASEINTGTSTTLAVTPNALNDSNFGRRVVEIIVFNPTTTLTTGDGKVEYAIPEEFNGMNLVRVSANVKTVSSSGAITIDLARCAATATGNSCSGTVSDMLSTNLTLDANENKSSTATAAVIDAANDDVATDQIVRIDVDGVGTGSQGLTVTLVFQLP